MVLLIKAANLDYQIDQDTIERFFADYGTVVDVELVPQHDGRFSGIALVEFSSPSEASAALDLDGNMLAGRNAHLSLWKNPPYSPLLNEKPKGCDTIWIGNLNFEITEEAVMDFFGECGDIADVRWPRDFTSWGHVQFSNPDDVDNAVAKMGEPLMGRPVDRKSVV